MVWTLVFVLVERLGFPLVLITFLSLGLAYHPPALPDAAGLLPHLSALGLGALALWTAYRVVRAALPDCGLMALATSAALAVLPGHVAALSSHALLGLAEAAVGLVLLGLVHLARTAALQRQQDAGETVRALLGTGAALRPTGAPVSAGQDLPAPSRPVTSAAAPRAPGPWRLGLLAGVGFWAGVALAAAPGALAVLALLPTGLLSVGREAGLRGRWLLAATARGALVAGAVAVVVAGGALPAARWAGGDPTLPQVLNRVAPGAPGLAAAVGSGFGTFWLPAGWPLLPYGTPVLWALALVSVLGLVGAALYGLSAARGTAGLAEEERAAFAVFYLAAGLALLGALAVVVQGATPGPGVLYPFLAPLALLGIIGFESWFPPLTRPLVVFGLLVSLFALNLYGLITPA